MKATELAGLRELPLAQLQAKLVELKQERFHLRFRSATEAIEQPIRFRTLRHDIARINTILRERAGEAK